MSDADWLRTIQRSLEGLGYSNPEQVSKWVIEHITRRPIYPHHTLDDLSASERIAINAVFDDVMSGTPLQYAFGTADFFNCQIMVGPGVLIPRPETEQLVELALMRCSGGEKILDLCTGSGCIPLAMAIERPDLPKLIGVDCSRDALAWAEKNKEALSVRNVDFREADLFDAVQGERFELITANPPYISRDEYKNLPDNVIKHEPELALFADNSGLEILDRICRTAPEYLISGGSLICEIGHDQGQAVNDLFEMNGFTDVRVSQDYGGRDRIVSGVRG